MSSYSTQPSTATPLFRPAINPTRDENLSPKNPEVQAMPRAAEMVSRGSERASGALGLAAARHRPARGRPYVSVTRLHYPNHNAQITLPDSGLAKNNLSKPNGNQSSAPLVYSAGKPLAS